MKYRVFLDTNIFIYGFEFPNSNSAKIIGMLNKGEIEAVISEQVVKEVTKYFEKYHSIELARYFRRYLIGSCVVAKKHNVLDVMNEYEGKIKPKDLEQLAVVKKLGIKYLIALDKDFEGFEEYITPKEFIEAVKPII